MKILLDENLPDTLVESLSERGHSVDSVNRLDLKGIANGALYTEVAIDYDLFFTKDAGFAHNVKEMEPSGDVKLIHVIIPQQEVKKFCLLFINHFIDTNWDQISNCEKWPDTYL